MSLPTPKPTQPQVTLFNDSVWVRHRKAGKTAGGILVPGEGATSVHTFIGVVLGKGPGRPATKDEIEQYATAYLDSLNVLEKGADNIWRWPIRTCEIGDTIAYSGFAMQFHPGGVGTKMNLIVRDSSIMCKIENMPPEPTEQEFESGLATAPKGRGPSLVLADAAGNPVGVVGP